MKSIFIKKSILIKIALSILLIPILLITVSLFLSYEIENALGRQSRVLYSGPEDLRAFMRQYGDFYILSGNLDQQTSMSNSQADIALEVYGDSASVYFSSEEISSVIAYERLSELLLQYGEVSAQGQSVDVYYELAQQEFTKEVENGQISVSLTVQFLLATIASLLAFAILVSGDAELVNDRGYTFFEGKMTMVAQFVSSALFSLCISAFITASIFVSANYLLAPLMPDVVTNFTLLSDRRAFFVLLFSGFILGLSTDALKISVKTIVGKTNRNNTDFLFISSFFVLCAIFITMFTDLGKMPYWSYFLPIINLHAIFKDAIMYGIEPGRFWLVIGINIALCVACMILSLKTAKTGVYLKKRY